MYLISSVILYTGIEIGKVSPVGMSVSRKIHTDGLDSGGLVYIPIYLLYMEYMI